MKPILTVNMAGDLSFIFLIENLLSKASFQTNLRLLLIASFCFSSIPIAFTSHFILMIFLIFLEHSLQRTQHSERAQAGKKFIEDSAPAILIVILYYMIPARPFS